MREKIPLDGLYKKLAIFIAGRRDGMLSVLGIEVCPEAYIIVVGFFVDKFWIRIDIARFGVQKALPMMVLLAGRMRETLETDQSVALNLIEMRLIYVFG